MTRPSLSELEDRLGYRFADRAHLVLALTHVGAAAKRTDSYQRLEFLGDRVLGMAIASMLYAAFPTEDEGQLSRRLAGLVRKESCSAVAASWGLEPHIKLGSGEAQNQALRQAVMGDICEAIIGAVYLDGGFEAAAALVARGFEGEMRAPARPLQDPKTALQEWAQGRGLTAPSYRLRARKGPDHAPAFTVAVAVQGYDEAAAEGASKRMAEQAAAAAFMAREGIGRTETPA